MAQELTNPARDIPNMEPAEAVSPFRTAVRNYTAELANLANRSNTLAEMNLEDFNELDADELCELLLAIGAVADVSNVMQKKITTIAGDRTEGLREALVGERWIMARKPGKRFFNTPIAAAQIARENNLLNDAEYAEIVPTPKPPEPTLSRSAWKKYVKERGGKLAKIDTDLTTEGRTQGAIEIKRREGAVDPPIADPVTGEIL